MAAVAAEPGAAVVPTTTTAAAADAEGPLEPGTGGPIRPNTDLETDVRREFSPVTELVAPHVKDGDVAAEECGHVGLERDAGAGKAAEENPAITTDNDQTVSKYPSPLVGPSERFSPAVVEPEAGRKVYQQRIPTDPQPSAVFLHSFPAHPLVTEAGLSLAEPAEPTTNVTTNEYYQNRAEARITQSVDISFISLTEPELRPGPAEDAPVAVPGTAAYTEPADGAVSDGNSDPLSVSESRGQTPAGTTAVNVDTATCYSHKYDFSYSQQNSIVSDELPVTSQPGSVHNVSPSPVSLSRNRPDSCSSSPCRSPKRRLMDTPNHKLEKTAGEPAVEPCSVESKPPVPCPGAAEPGSVEQLTPGSEVRVSLDHIIDDALVVSFRVGEKIFSGVLMDLSRRFGPYGIPITVFPKRDHKNRPQPSMQLHQEIDGANGPAERQVVQDVVSSSHALPQREELEVEAIAASKPLHPPASPPHPWSSKPPPLFQEGAPYPPPLFIRDTYSQALPQPPPRRIRRPRRRYRWEEPVSIMNAIKLRPRQVLCDKCRGVVSAGGPREEGSRRRRHGEGGASSSSSSVVVKRLRSDAPREEKTGRSGRPASSSSSSSSSSRVLRGVASSSSSLSSSHATSSGRVRLERSKTRRVLTRASPSTPTPPPRPPPQTKRQPREVSTTHSHAHTQTVTRAAALQHQTQKVHFTRRLQHLSPPGPSALPPRLRLKPQRYRTDDHAPPTTKPASSSAPSAQVTPPPSTTAPHAPPLPSPPTLILASRCG